MGLFDSLGSKKKKKVDDQVREEFGEHQQKMRARLEEYDYEDFEEENEFEDPVTKQDIDRIRKQLLHTHKDLVIGAVEEEYDRDELKEIIIAQFGYETRNGDPQLVNYVLREVLSGVDLLDLPNVVDENTGNRPLSPQEQLAPIRQQMARGARSVQSYSTAGSSIEDIPVAKKRRLNQAYDELYGDVEEDYEAVDYVSPEHRGVVGIDPSLLQDITDAKQNEDIQRLADLRRENERLLQRSLEKQAQQNAGREGFKQPAKGLSIEELGEAGIIRQNQQRLQAWLSKGEDGATVDGSGRRVSPGVPSQRKRAMQVPDMLGLEEIDAAMAEKGASDRMQQRRQRSVDPSDKDKILALRKNIKVEDVAMYDGDALEDSAKGTEQDPADFINDQTLATIRDALVQAYPGLVIRGMMEQEARDELEKEVRDIYSRQTRNGQDFLVEYIVRETVGTGVIETILENDPSITDIGYDGDKLIIESNDNKYIYKSSQDINDEYIIRLVNKFAYANGRDFTGKNPVFDGKFNNIRINAMHGDNTASGKVTMALRVVRPMLALTEETFHTFAPHYIYQLLHATVLAQGNLMLAGETGTGKTELQKLLASFIPFNQRIVLIEDVAETFLKDMFPEKDIFSWLTSPDSDITTLVKAALRNNPRWILVSETRGMEAYEMIQAVLSGHSIITTLHAINAEAIPKRLVNMAKMGYEFSEEALEADIRRYFDFGVHIVRRTYKGKTIRYLSELRYFDEVEDITVFQQDYADGNLIAQANVIPDALKRRIKQADGASHDEFIEHRAHTRPIHVDAVEEENGRTRLDLFIEDVGRLLTYDEVENIVTKNIMDPEKMGSYGRKAKDVTPEDSDEDLVNTSNVNPEKDEVAPKVAGVKPSTNSSSTSRRTPNSEESKPRPNGQRPKPQQAKSSSQAQQKPVRKQATSEQAQKKKRRRVPKSAETDKVIESKPLADMVKKKAVKVQPVNTSPVGGAVPVEEPNRQRAVSQPGVKKQ